MTQVQVLLADQSEEFMEVVSEWLTTDPDFRVVGKARRGLQALELARSLSPDLVLVDVTLPDLNGFQVARRIKSMPAPPAVVLVAFHDSETARREARAAGADELIAKSDVTGGLQELVRKLVVQRSSVPKTDRAGAASEVQVRRSTKQGPRRDLS